MPEFTPEFINDCALMLACGYVANDAWEKRNIFLGLIAIGFFAAAVAL